MLRPRTSRLAPFAAPFLLAAACDGGTGGDDDSASDPAADSAAYASLAASLEQDRSEFLGEEADEILARGDSLFWLEFPGFDPTLHRWSEATGETLDYTFAISVGGTYNWRGNDQVVVTAEWGDDQVLYRVYDAAATGSRLATVAFPAPTDGTRWWAYAVDGEALYLVTPAENTPVQVSATPGADPEALFTLEDRGCEPGIFYDFDVEGDTMVFVESGRIWTVDLSDGPATWLGNDTEITGSVTFDRDHVLFAAADGLWVWTRADGSLVELGEAIGEADYRVNDTYATAHHVSGDGATLHGDQVVYIGNMGVFAYRLGPGDVAPILLEPLDAPVRVEYRNPQVLSDGTLFVQALESESGSVGADGPIYRVETEVLGPE